MDTLCERTGLKKLNKVAVLKGWRNIRISKRKVGGWRAMDTGLTLFSYTKLPLFFFFFMTLKDVMRRYWNIWKKYETVYKMMKLNTMVYLVNQYIDISKFWNRLPLIFLDLVYFWKYGASIYKLISIKLHDTGWRLKLTIFHITSIR